MSAVARRYAKALFALAKEQRVVESAAGELERVAAIAAVPAVHQVLRSPLLSAEQRRTFAETLIADAALSDLLTRFVRLLTDHRRLAELPSIYDNFQHLLDAELGRVRIAIRSATVLEPQQERDLVATFAGVTGKQVIPAVDVDPDLLGGIVVEVEGKVYDGSVRTQFERLAKQLAETDALL